MRSKLFVPLILVLMASSATCLSQETVVIRADTAAGIAYNNPVWSPDGKTIAYVAMPYVADPNEPTYCRKGKSVHLATPAGGIWKTKLLAKDADWPVWSPDRKQIAFRQNGLAVMALATGKTKRLTKDSGLDEDGDVNELHVPISWSPNGRYMLYKLVWQEGRALTVRDLKTGKDRRIAEDAPDAIWMADGKLLAAQCGSEEGSQQSWLRVVNPVTGSTRTVLKDRSVRSPFIPKDASYAWVYVAENAPKGEGIYRVDLKSGALTKQIAVHAKELYWSPTGKQFAFIADWSPRAGVETLSCVYVGSTVNWRFKIASKNALRAEDDMHSHLAWSPDGKKIAFVTAEGGISVLKL